MNDLLLRQVRIVDPGGPHHDETVDILLRDGKVARVGARLQRQQAEELRMEGLHASPGWLDLRMRVPDPGEEHKQDLPNALDAAAAGGFTAVGILPSTTPVMDARGGVDHVLRRSAGHAVRALPIAALTNGCKVEQFSEAYDLLQSGAVALCDDQRPVRNTRLMLLALQYALNFNGRVMSFPLDPDLLANGQMHEGHQSVRLGLRGIPALAEQVQVARDLALLAYTGSRLHIATVSTAEAVALIREAKARKLNVTASVAAHNLLLDDSRLRGFDTNYKVMPPLRDPQHIEALREAVKDGTIDTITSDHRPEDVEHKKVEFPQAATGIIGTETAYAVATTAMKGRLSTRRLVERLCHGPRHVLGQGVPHIAADTVAEITLFRPDLEWTVAEGDLVSRSHNTPFLGQRLVGRPVGICANGRSMLAPAFMELTA